MATRTREGHSILQRAASALARWRRGEPQAAGISNRPTEKERGLQEDLPPRGTARGETEPTLAPRPAEHPAPRDPAPKRERAKTPPPE